MSDRIKKIFEEKGRKLVTFTTAGDPDLERSFLTLLTNSGYPGRKFEKKIDFTELYKQRSN